MLELAPIVGSRKEVIYLNILRLGMGVGGGGEGVGVLGL